MSKFGTVLQTLIIDGVDYSSDQGLAGDGLKISYKNERWFMSTGQGGAGLRSENQAKDNIDFSITAFKGSPLYAKLMNLSKTGNLFKMSYKDTIKESGEISIMSVEGASIQKPGNEYSLKPAADESNIVVTFPGAAFAGRIINS